MTLAICIAAVFALVSILCLVGWPLVARGFDGPGDWWAQPDQRVWAIGVLVAILAALVFAQSPLAPDAPTVHSGTEMGPTTA